MATKLKNSSRSGGAKALSFVLFVVCVTAFVLLLIYAEGWSDISAGDHFAGRPFEESEFLNRETQRSMNYVLSAAGWWSSTASEAEEAVRYNSHLLNELEDDVYYYVETPFVQKTNTVQSADWFRGRDVWYMQENDRSEHSYMFYPLHFSTSFFGEGEYNWDTSEWSSAFKLRFALDDGYVSQLRETYNGQVGVFWWLASAMILTGLLTLVSLLHLLAVCGRRAGSDEVHLTTLDKLWLDVSLGAGIGLGALAALAIEGLHFRITDANMSRFMVYVGILVAASAAVILWWLLCVVKRVKNRSVLKHTLIYSVLAWLLRPFVRFGRALADGMPLTVWVGVGLFGYTVLHMILLTASRRDFDFVIPLALLPIAALIFLLWRAAALSKVAKGLDRLAKGDYNTPVEVHGRGVMRIMAKNVNAATDGLKVAVEDALRSERFKSELITNVSHDLRTPLTSVITYADLLQSEGLDCPDAPQYLEVIRQKAQRLQGLTEDLFEASKASSGSTRAVLSPIDLHQLIEQALGEMGDRLNAVPLDVRFSGQCGLVMADGKLLCRVFENLLRNMEKYALPGTRVYITIEQPVPGGGVTVTLRNISKAPLDGDAERLAERFTRGDEARSSEGSGLGLAIVKSFMELQKGRCELAADGDLFKVTLSLPGVGPV